MKKNAGSQERIHIERLPVGEQNLETIQKQCFQEPMWLEAPQGSRLVIIPQQGLMTPHFILKQSLQERAIYSAETIAELITMMRQQAWTRRLLHEDARNALSDWQIAKPVVIDSAQ